MLNIKGKSSANTNNNIPVNNTSGVKSKPEPIGNNNAKQVPVSINL